MSDPAPTRPPLVQQKPVEQPSADEDANIRRGLDVIQSMIDISSVRLEGLRTQCATSSELTQQEIRTLEAKLVRMFSDLLITKAKLPERLPSGLPPATDEELRQWLRIVGLNAETVDAMRPHCDSLEQLLQLDDTELRSLLAHSPQPREEDARRLLRAIANLKRCRQMLVAGGDRETIAAVELCWDSWDRHHHTHHHHHRSGTSPRPHHRSAGLPKPKSLSRTAGATMASPQHSGGVGGAHRSPQQGVAGGGEPSSLAHQFSPPSADVAAAQLAAALGSRRPTISPEEMSVGQMTATPPMSPSPPSSPSTTTTTSSSTAGATGGQSAGIAGSTTSMRSSSGGSTTGIAVQGFGYGSGSSAGQHRQFPTTPPPRRKLQAASKLSEHQVMLAANNQSMPKQPPGHAGFALTSFGGGDAGLGRAVSTAESTDFTLDLTAPPPYSQYPSNNHNAPHGEQLSMLQVPRSPGTPLALQRGGVAGVGVGSGALGPMQSSTSSESSTSPHGHRFTKKFKVMSTCDLCSKQMFFGLKCKECKYRCHKDCEQNVASTCTAFRKSQQMQQADVVFMASHSPNLGNRSSGALLSSGAAGSMGGLHALRAAGRRDRLRSTDYHGGVGMKMTGTESGGSAGSSCNSSTPSSPALLTLTSHTLQNTPSTPLLPVAGGGGGGVSSSSTSSSTLVKTAPSAPTGGPTQHATSTNKTQFKFPEVSQIYKPDTVGSITLETHLIRQEQQQKQMQNARLQLAHQQQSSVPGSPRNYGRRAPSGAGLKSPPEVTVDSTAAAASSSSADAEAPTAGGSGALPATARGTLQIPTITKEVTL